MTDEVFEKVDLPSGGWAEFRDPEDVTEAQRRPLKRLQLRIGMDKNLRDAISAMIEDEAAPQSITTMQSASFTDEQVDLLSNFPDMVTLTLLAAWSFETPISLEGIQSIPGKDYDALIMAAGKHQAKLMPNFDPTPRDQDSPTGPSSD